MKANKIKFTVSDVDLRSASNDDSDDLIESGGACSLIVTAACAFTVRLLSGNSDVLLGVV